MIKRLFILTLAALMLLSCFTFAGCNKEEAPDATEESASATELEEIIDGILLSGENKYDIIYPEESKELKALALKVYDKLISLSPVGIYYSVTTDKKAANGTPEILIGNTNRAASETAKGKLSQYYDFTIDVGEKTIAIYANTNKRLEDAVKYFTKNVKASKDKVYYTLTENYVDVYKGLHPNAAIDDNMLKDYKIVLPADANEIQKNAASTLALVLEEECGSVIPVIYDSEPATNLEILLGKTNRPESEYPSDTNDRLFASGSKIVVAPSTDEGYSRLINMLQKEFSLRSGKLKGSAIKVNSLSYAAIKSISFGAVNISEQTDGLRFNKFSQKQIDEWTMFNRYNEASGSTGIRLDFYTDSSSFYFRGIAGKKFELFVNGESVKISSDGYIEAELDNTQENRVTLLFPNHQVNATLYELRLDESASIRPYEYSRKFLIVGDSITQGYSSVTDSLSWANRITRMFDADSVIQAISGGTFRSSTLDPDVEFTPDYIFVAYGTNDWSGGSSMESFKANAQAYYDKLAELYPNATIIGITPIWRKDNHARSVGEFDDMCAELKTIIESVGGYAVNGVDLVPHDRKYYGEDICLHPNDEGFEFYANNLYEAVKDIIK